MLTGWVRNELFMFGWRRRLQTPFVALLLNARVVFSEPMGVESTQVVYKFWTGGVMPTGWIRNELFMFGWMRAGRRHTPFAALLPSARVRFSGPMSVESAQVGYKFWTEKA